VVSLWLYTFKGISKLDKYVQIAQLCLREIKPEFRSFNLFISDAAPYMIKAGKIFKILYSRLFHVTCTAHLIHNCTSLIKNKYNDVNNLIASIKSLTKKNKTHK